MALSGGPDSTALLHLLHDCSAQLNVQLVAAHFDHGLRETSALEASSVAERAGELGVRCLTGRPAAPLAFKQDALRSARYGWLEATRRDVGAARIATGHQADDQAETVLFRIMRGSGLRGLAGIPLRRGAIVRPLLRFRRSEIVDYLDEWSIPWLDDPSNTDPRWARSRIREVVLPALQDSDEVTGRLIALSACAARVEALQDALAAVLMEDTAACGTHEPARRIELDLASLRAAGPELQARVVRRAAHGLGVQLSRGGTRAAVEFISRGLSGGRVAVGGGLVVSREYGLLRVHPEVLAKTVHPHDRWLEIPGAWPGGGSVCIGGRRLSVKWWPRKAPASRDPARIAVPVAGGHYPLRFREWRAGDRIFLPGGTRKLKRLFNDHRIPLSSRKQTPVLADRDERVLWVVGLAVAAPERGGGSDAHFLEFELRDE